MDLYERLINKNATLSVIGLGYVGMPLGVKKKKKVNTIGYDNNPDKVKLYHQGIDPTFEVGNEAISQQLWSSHTIQKNYKEPISML